MHVLLLVLDITLLLYFLNQGVKSSTKLVSFFAIIQLILYAIYLVVRVDSELPLFLVDKLSIMMYFVINFVGGLIIIYALKYIDSENISQRKKNSFIAMLLFFVVVMNLIVSVDSIEVFFLLFELTTLCSYLLIKFREDEVAVSNALRALWMNQIGGVAILITLITSSIYYETIYFSELLARVDSEFIFIPIVFLIVAAYVKSATLPMQDWLLGAMVAPTPVSAILHSATMVKIAPFLILKISVAFTPYISLVVALFGAFVFLAASLMALNKDFFKEILGLSTIALLSLMMSLAAMQNESATNAAILLIVFHAISKALLFLQAGVLEKVHHVKYVSDIESLVHTAPKTLFFIIVGFASLTLPPFGIFVAKFMAIESINSLMSTNPLYIIQLIFLVLGSVVLTILYFKVTTKLFYKNMLSELKNEKLPWQYFIPSLMLCASLFVGMFFMTSFSNLTALDVLIPAILIFITPLLLYFISINKAVQTTPYNCGEKDKFLISSYYFSLSKEQTKVLLFISIIFIVLTILGGF